MIVSCRNVLKKTKSHNGHLRSFKSHNGHLQLSGQTLRVWSLATDICEFQVSQRTFAEFLVFQHPSACSSQMRRFPISQCLQLPDAAFSNIPALAAPRYYVFQHPSTCSSQIPRRQFAECALFSSALFKCRRCEIWACEISTTHPSTHQFHNCEISE